MSRASSGSGLRRLLIANRGEIAVRIVRACKDLGIESVAAHSEADRDTLVVRLADQAICVGGAAASESYLNVDALLAAAHHLGCDAVHPGYGFLAENSDFAARCEEAGLTFVGPTAETISVLGDKSRARQLALEVGVPVVPGWEVSHAALQRSGEAVTTFPVLIKAAAGGGGRGLRRVDRAEDLQAAMGEASAEALQAFGEPGLYIERYITKARHVEVQVLGDGRGGVVDLGERDCSVQRRYQKLVEEAPSPVLDDEARRRISQDARRMVSQVDYRGAGTVEFLYDVEAREHFFIEVNTRLQVEHPVTELLTGVDLVEWQLRVARGEPLEQVSGQIRPRGHVIEYRVNAEDPHDGFRPQAGDLADWSVPQGPGVRVDSHVTAGSRISPFYDSMLAKLIVYGLDREQVLRRSRRALDEFEVAGLPTTVPFHRWLVDEPDFVASKHHTGWLDARWLPAARPGGEERQGC